MRVTDYGSALFNLQQIQDNRQQQDRLQRQLSSGRRLLRDSDDPLAGQEVQLVRRSINYTEFYKSNAIRAEALIKYSDSTINGATNLVYQAMQVAQQSNTSLLSSDDRVIAAKLIRDIRENMVSIANSSYQGEYVFGGLESSTQPFQFVDPSDTAHSVVTYSGTVEDRVVPVMDQAEVIAALSGQSVFMSPDIFESLRQLADAVEIGDQATISSQLINLEQGRASLTQARAKLGYEMQNIQNVTTQLNDISVNLTERLSTLEDADVAQIAGDLALHQTAVQASYYAHGQIGRRSLFDFLG